MYITIPITLVLLPIPKLPNVINPYIHNDNMYIHKIYVLYPR